MSDATLASPSRAKGMTAATGWAIAVFAGAILTLVFRHNVNWDEFYFLSLVYDYGAGRLDRPLQTIHVHFFQWLTSLPGQEMMQIMAGRLVMFACLGVTSWSIFLVSRRMAGQGAALLAVLGFLTAGFVVGHGASFRADPLAASLLMAAFALVMTTRMRPLHMLAISILVAAALLVTIKSGLYLPAFLGALLWRADEKGVSLRALGAGVAALGLAGLGYMLHASGLTVAEGKDGASNAMNALQTAILSQEFLPRAGVVRLWLLLTLAPVLMALAGLIRAQGLRHRAALLLMVAPVASVLIYRNAFPYFFPFIVPPLMVVAAIGAARLGHVARLVLFAVMLFSGGLQTVLSLQEDTKTQRAVIAEVHTLFPQPVAYIGRNGMISSFPRHGPFLSTWGLQTYRKTGVPVFADIVEQVAPPLLIANSNPILQAVTRTSPTQTCCPLLAPDARALQEAYVHHWGPLWLLGQERLLAGEAAEIAIPRDGVYRLETDAPVTIDGAEIKPGASVQLGKGRHGLEGPEGTVVRLIWATARTSGTPPMLSAPLDYNFWSL